MRDENGLRFPWCLKIVSIESMDSLQISLYNILCGSSVSRREDAAGLSDCLVDFSDLPRALTRDSVECFSGLRVLRIPISLSRTSLLSVRLSPVVVAADCFRECVVVELRRSFSPPTSADGTRGLDEEEA